MDSLSSSTGSGKIASLFVTALIAAGLGVVFDALGLRSFGWKLFQELLKKGSETALSSGDSAIAPVLTADEIFWHSIKDAAAPGLFEEFVKKFPKSPRLAEAEATLRRLRLASPPAQTPPSIPATEMTPTREVKPALQCITFNGRRECG